MEDTDKAKTCEYMVLKYKNKRLKYLIKKGLRINFLEIQTEVAEKMDRM
jgi:hypothetical protein